MRTLPKYVLSAIVTLMTVLVFTVSAYAHTPNIGLPNYCYYYNVHDKPSGDDPHPLAIFIEDLFKGKDYYGCAVKSSKFPAYKGWAAHVQSNGSACGSAASQLLPKHPAFSSDYAMMCPAIFQYIPVWKYTTSGFVKTTTSETPLAPYTLKNTTYVHPYGNHAGWRWVYKNNTWYVIETKYVMLAWLVAL